MIFVFRSSDGRRTPRFIAAAVSALAVLSLAACAEDSGNNGDVVNQGYQSGDGSVRTWTVDERKGNVELSGVDYAGDPVNWSDYEGNVVVINTWYAACPPCRVEAPALAAVEAAYADQGVKFLGINRTDDSGAAQAFEREFDVNWPSINDESGSAIASLAGVVPVKAVPTTIVLDRQSRVTARVLGQVDQSTLDTLVREALAEEG